jgi:hypothetical protein
MIYGVYSNEVVVIPNVPSFDTTPVMGLTATPSDGTVTLNWQPQATAVNYEIQRKSSAPGAAFQTIQTVGAVTQYVDNAANTPGIAGGAPVNGNTYTYRVRATKS